MQAHRLHIEVAELNNPSDGKGIRGIPSAVEMGNKKKYKFTQIVAVARFLIFQMRILDIYNDYKSKVVQLNSISVGKEITGIEKPKHTVSQYVSKAPALIGTEHFRSLCFICDPNIFHIWCQSSPCS